MSAREVDPSHLHPAFRERRADLAARVAEARLPIEPFESWRSPARQAFLFAEGRTPGVGSPGHHVTFEAAWGSLHQYGLAEDWVWWFNGAWTWAPPAGHAWEEFHELAARAGLMKLDFEAPHVQLPGVSGRALLAGELPYPAGGDASWEANLEAAIVAWGRGQRIVNGQVNPGAPPLVAGRPPVPAPPPGLVYDQALGVCRAV